MKKIILTLIAITFSFPSYGENEIIHNTDHSVRLLKTIKLDSNKFVYLTARDNGHVLGQKFLVQKRVSCNGSVEDFSKLEVLDSYSVCNMKPESITLNKNQTAVAMLSKSADVDRYHRDIESGLTSPEINCRKNTEILKFSLNDICE
jgi:hypothetical protein